MDYPFAYPFPGPEPVAAAGGSTNCILDINRPRQMPPPGVRKSSALELTAAAINQINGLSSRFNAGPTRLVVTNAKKGGL
jgi:hypothetical protein